MDRSVRMSETEEKIMEVLWDAEGPMSGAQLIEYFAREHGKVWKAPTLATFMARLTQKGLVASEQRGRTPYYFPIESREQYSESVAREILDTMYDGSVKRFFAALYGDRPISERDREELRAWLDKE